ncbi:TIGR03016 family PEP-CTERM system-associated outer membrane protein [Niveibacterium terrae]|uniref:TIGR03016 family PEP-CTERM system-associated outer membrane protein n=1 Tax=Niveibacterium terrae TaxID=3373598 RepID=UPI003A94E8B0
MDMATDMVSAALNLPRLLSWALAGGAMGLILQPGFALAEPGDRSWIVEPDLNVGLTWSDNASLASGSRQSDTTLNVDPGLSLSGRSGGAEAALKLRLNNVIYARQTDLNRTSLYGNGTGSFDLYERRLMLDASASSSRERLSIFGTPAATGYDSGGQANFQTYSLSPYWRVQGSGFNGEARYRASWADADSSTYQQSLRHDASLSLGSTTVKPVGWSLSGLYSLTDYRDTNDIRTASLRATGFHALDPLLIARLIGGYEHNDYSDSASRNALIYGGGLEWTPSPRTRMTGQIEKRFFGSGYNVDFDWRGPLSGVNMHLSRDVSTSSQTLGVGELLSLYLAQYAALASQIPDPVERARRVERDWAARGLPALGQGVSYISSAYYVERRAQLTGSLTGARHSLSLSTYYSQRNRLLDPALMSASDDLSAYQRTREWGVSLYASHSLSPRTQLNLSGTLSRSQGEGDASTGASTRRRSVQAGTTGTLGPHSSGAVLYRYSSSSGVSEYRENAVVANLGLHF